MKVGDILYCHTACIMEYGIKSTTKNRQYLVERIELSENKLFIRDDQGSKHSFAITDNGHSHYKKWFYTISEMRARKMIKISNI